MNKRVQNKPVQYDPQFFTLWWFQHWSGSTAEDCFKAGFLAALALKALR